MESDPSELTALQKKIPGAQVSKGSLTKSLTASKPEDAAEELKNLGDVLRKAAKQPGRI